VIRLLQGPQLGVLKVRRAMLTTDRFTGCPHLKVPAQVVFYRARAGYSGPDHLRYEVTDAKGEVDVFDITITVKLAPPPPTPSAPTEGIDRGTLPSPTTPNAPTSAGKGNSQ